MIKIGFPRMHKEINEKRDFLPDFFKMLNKDGVEFHLEKGYGKDLGFNEKDYLMSNSAIKFSENRECYEKDIVIVLRAPEFNEINYMKDGSILVSMLHYSTRKKRRALLKEKNIYTVSLDSIRNDSLERIVVNFDGTSRYGMGVAFEELSKSMKDFYSKDREFINVSIMGMGMIGFKAAHAARIYGSNTCNNAMNLLKAKGVLIKMLPRNITCDTDDMINILRETDILVDASTRQNVCEYILRNEYIKYLKTSSIILDLTADPYLTDITPIQVKAIEGIPTGTLDKYVIYPYDDLYNTLPHGVDATNRRTVVSCNAWPGVNPLDCMKVYGQQLVPIINKIILTDVKKYSIQDDNYFIRAIYRASLEYFGKENPSL